jgi:hypothetical protein
MKKADVEKEKIKLQKAKFKLQKEYVKFQNEKVEIRVRNGTEQVEIGIPVGMFSEQTVRLIQPLIRECASL